MQQKKILWVSRLGFPCSYHYVTKSLWEGFKTTPNIFQLYDFTFLTLTIAPRPDQVQTFLKEFKIHPSKFYYPNIDFDTSTPEDEHFETICLAGWLSIIEVIKQVKPDLVIVLEDTEPAKKLGIRMNLAIEKGEIKKTFKTVAYIPVDCHNVESIAKGIEFDHYLSPTKYGAQEFRKIHDNVFDLAHSIRQQSDTRTAKVRDKKEDVFKVISVNTNHIRKRWDLVFQAYLLFAQMYKEPCLLTVKSMVLKGVTSKATLIPNTVFDLVEEYKKWSERMPASNAQIRFYSSEIPVDQLNEMYREADVGLYMTSGEGFGLTPLEGAAFGMPQIVPDNSSFRELFPYYPYRVKTQETSLYLSRECLGSESNSYLCLLKSYIYDKEGFEERIENKIAQIPSLVVSHIRTNLNFGGGSIPVIQHFFTLTECENYIQNQQLLPRFQVLINLDVDFLRRQKWDKYPDSLRSEGRYEMYAKKENITSRTGDGTPSCGIASPEDAAQKLLKLARDPQERERAGAMCKHYASKFTTEEVNNKFFNIIRHIMPTLCPVVILSYERSGTHFLINSLVENFGYDKTWIDIDDLIAFPPGTPFQFNKIYKCHHCASNIVSYNFKGCSLIKLVRDKEDNLKSYQKYLYLVFWDEGPKIKPDMESFREDDVTRDNEEIPKTSLEVFSEHKTMGFQERYQDRKNITQSQRYDDYHSSFDSAPPNLINSIRYEDMIQRFDNVMLSLNPLKGFFKPTKIDTTVL
uniref:Glycosyltransferase n=1 Tax=Marseillevirus LCMAC101 TaxID=2506602 RepID=A0A481YRA0_9VIRU|nr:MAG: glycosyltransferase [Marseillevirus LCMAC101]